MTDAGDVRFYSVVLFKIASLFLALLLGLQLIKDQLPFPYDITAVLTLEQFLFIFAILIVTVLAFIEGRTLQAREGKGISGKLGGLTFGVVILYIVAGFGVYFTYLIFTGYNFDNSTTNAYIGYFLLVGVFMIFINAREQIFKRFLK